MLDEAMRGNISRGRCETTTAHGLRFGVSVAVLEGTVERAAREAVRQRIRETGTPVSAGSYSGCSNAFTRGSSHRSGPLRCLSLPLLARGGRHHQVTTRSLCSPHRQSPLRFGSFRRSPIRAWLECAQMRPQVGPTKASQTGSSLPGSATRHRRNHTGVHRSRLSIRFQLR